MSPLMTRNGLEGALDTESSVAWSLYFRTTRAMEEASLSSQTSLIPGSISVIWANHLIWLGLSVFILRKMWGGGGGGWNLHMIIVRIHSD